MADQAKSVSRSVYLDTQAAESNMKSLVATGTSLKETINKGEAAGKSMVKELAKLETVNANIKKVQEQLDKGLKPTMQQQSTLVRQLRNELARLSESDPEFATKLANYRKQNAALTEMGNRLKVVEENGSRFGKVFTHVTEVIGSLFVLDKVKDFFSGIFAGGIEEADQAAEAIDELRVSLLNVGRIDVFERLIGRADEFANKYKALDNDDITKVFSKLVDLGKLTEEQITETTDVIINYARKQKVSLSDATDVITKGFEGSGKALKIYGINMKDAHDFASRYSLVIDGLGNKIKGAEAAFEQTNQGIKKGFQQRMRDLKEDIGNFLYSLTRMEEKQLQSAITAKRDADQATTLVSRYEQLSKQTKLTTADKEELAKITTTLAGKFGDSVVEVDKETGALKLNVQATKDLITQKLLLANNKAVEIAGKLNKAQQDEADNLSKLSTNTKLYNEGLKEVGKTQKEINKSVQYYATGGGMAGGGTGVTDTRTDQEKGLDTFIGAIYNTGKAAKANREDISKYTKQLEELGFTADAVNKLLNPRGPGTIIGAGMGSGDTDNDALKKIEELRKKFDELMSKVRVSNAKVASPLEGEFARINAELRTQMALIDEAMKKGAISHKEAMAAITEVQMVAEKERNAALANAEKDSRAKRRKDLQEIREAFELIKQARLEESPGVGPKSDLPNSLDKSNALYKRDRLAGAELAVLTSKAAQRLEAQNKLLDQEEFNELNTTEKTEQEKELIRQKYEDKRKALTLSVAEDNLKEILSFAKQGLIFWELSVTSPLQTKTASCSCSCGTMNWPNRVCSDYSSPKYSLPRKLRPAYRQ
jgi:CII-binding regulator of phage lambda lysogenization HflD